MNFKSKLIILIVNLIAISYVQSFPDSFDDFDKRWKEAEDRHRDFSKNFDEQWKESSERHDKFQNVFFIVFFLILGIIVIVFVGIITFSILVCLGVVNAPRFGCKFLKDISVVIELCAAALWYVVKNSKSAGKLL
jgi:hypothetical protein